MYVPGYLNAMLVSSLLMDRQPKFKVEYPRNEVIVMIDAWNEEAFIESTLRYIKNQDYNGHVKVIVIDNNSTDMIQCSQCRPSSCHNRACLDA